MLAALAISVPLLILALAMIALHLRGWRHARQHIDDARERDFLYRQFRRRMQVSSMLALLSIGIFVGLLIPIREYPSLYVFFWFGILLFVFWMLLLALGDLVIARQRVALMHRDRLRAQAQLAAELKRIRQQKEGT